VAQKVGGQAVFRGVMLRDERRWAVAVRMPTGEIAVRSDPLPTWGRRWKPVPIVRGVVGVAQALPIGFRAMRWSRVKGLGTPTGGLRALLRIAGALFALLVVPPWVTDRLVGELHNNWVSVVVDNLMTVAALVAFSALTGRLSDLRMLFEYHGAEHKVVAAHEAGVPMTPATVSPFSTRHVRCGTSLLVVIAVVAAVAAVLELPAIVAVPLVIGIAVELQGRAAANLRRPWVRALVRPGLALQRLTTREPSAEQLEVAIAAFHAVTTSAAQPSRVETVAVPA
jgi:uncharacterized protein YqhQ